MREKYKPETYTPEQLGAHVRKQTKGIIRYARETGKAGKPDDYTVEQHIEGVLYFIYNMNRQTPAKTEEVHEQHIPLREDWEREAHAEGVLYHLGEGRLEAEDEEKVNSEE